MNLTAQPIAVDTEIAGRILNAIVGPLEAAGFTIADHSVSEHGLVVTGPDVGYVEISFTELDTDGPDAPDDPAFSRPLPAIAGGCEVLDPADYDATFDEWLDHLDADYPPADQAEEMRDWYAAHPLAEFNASRLD